MWGLLFETPLTINVSFSSIPSQAIVAELGSKIDLNQNSTQIDHQKKTKIRYFNGIETRLQHELFAIGLLTREFKSVPNRRRPSETLSHGRSKLDFPYVRVCDQ